MVLLHGQLADVPLVEFRVAAQSRHVAANAGLFRGYVGGPGSIEPYYTRRMRVIVVSQTYRIHRQIDSLLNEFAKHGGNTPLPEVPAYLIPESHREYGTSRFADPTGPHPGIRSSRLRMTGQKGRAETINGGEWKMLPACWRLWIYFQFPASPSALIAFSCSMVILYIRI